MLNNYEPFVALRHIRRRNTGFLSTITWIAIIGVFIGVTALTTVISVTGGFQEAFQERVLGINSHILVIKHGIDFNFYPEVQDALEEVKGVKASSPFIFHEMIASHESESKGVAVKGIDPQTLGEVSQLPSYLKQKDALRKLEYERFPEDGEKSTARILVGEELADKLKLDVGDEFRVTSPLSQLDPSEWSSKGDRPAHMLFQVAGIYRSGFYEYDSRMVMVDYRVLQDFFQRGDSVTGIDIRVTDVFQVDAIGERIRQKLARNDFRPSKFEIMDWKELNRNLFTSLSLQRTVLAVLICFIVLVACFNVICTLLMIVLDKKKEISVFKAMGAPKKQIMTIFVYEGLLIGAVGTVSGLIGGVLVSLGIKYTDFGLDPSIYMIDHLPVRLVWYEFAGVGLVSMFICLLATLGPSIWAASFNPVDGIRYE